MSESGNRVVEAFLDYVKTKYAREEQHGKNKAALANLINQKFSPLVSDLQKAMRASLYECSTNWSGDRNTLTLRFMQQDPFGQVKPFLEFKLKGVATPDGYAIATDERESRNVWSNSDGEEHLSERISEFLLAEIERAKAKLME